MANLLSNLLTQLENDEIKYFLVKGKDLYSENKISVLQNDNNSEKIGIILPTMLGGFEVKPTWDFYIDFLDGKEKPGCVFNKFKIDRVLNSDGIVATTITQNETEVKATFEEKEITIPFSKVINNAAAINGELYYLESNVRYSKDGETFISRISHENFEDSAAVSVDYPSSYADSIYFIKTSPNLTAKNTHDNDLNIDYLYLEWTLDSKVTQFAGNVEFSIRIEDSTTNYKWQSNTSKLTVKPNLKEFYYLQNEVEENYVIQNRKIVPVGNFENILVKGDTNSNKLFYKMNRYFQGQDMLAEKIIKVEEQNEIVEYPVKKIANLIGEEPFIIEKDNKYLCLNTNYIIQSATFVGADKKIHELDVNNNLIIEYENENHIFSNIKIERFYNINTYHYNYKLSWTTDSDKFKQEIILLNLTDPFNILKEGQGTFLLTPVVNLISNGFNLNGQSLDILDSYRVIPVFNRLIRFVFTNQSGDYGDYTDGEIEYINTTDNYFIFSWTPDNRATRSEGDLNYCIEFYIKSTENLLNIDGSVTSVETRNYSWSTLPSTVKIENNLANTGNIDYIPSWTSYIEEDLMSVVNEYIYTNIQKQQDELVDTLLNRFLAEYSEVKTQKALQQSNNSYIGSIDLDGKNREIIIEFDKGTPIKLVVNSTEEGKVITDEGKLSKIENIANDYQTNIIIDGKYYYVIYQLARQFVIFYSLDKDNGQPLGPFIKNTVAEELQKLKANIYTNGESFSAASIVENGKTIEESLTNFMKKTASYFFATGREGDTSLETQFRESFINLTQYLMAVYDVERSVYLMTKEQFEDTTAAETEIEALSLDGGVLEDYIKVSNDNKWYNFDYSIIYDKKGSKEGLFLKCENDTDFYYEAAPIYPTSVERTEFSYPMVVLEDKGSQVDQFLYTFKEYNTDNELYYYKEIENKKQIIEESTTLFDSAIIKSINELIGEIGAKESGKYYVIEETDDIKKYVNVNVTNVGKDDQRDIYKLSIPIYIKVIPVIFANFIHSSDEWKKPDLVCDTIFPQNAAVKFDWNEQKGIPVLQTLTDRFREEVSNMQKTLIDTVNDEIKATADSIAAVVIGEPNQSNTYTIVEQDEDKDGIKSYSVALGENFSLTDEAIQNSLIRKVFDGLQNSLSYYAADSTDGALATIYSQYIAVLNNVISSLQSTYEQNAADLITILQSYNEVPKISYDGSTLNITMNKNNS